MIGLCCLLLIGGMVCGSGFAVCLICWLVGLTCCLLCLTFVALGLL